MNFKIIVYRLRILDSTKNNLNLDRIVQIGCVELEHFNRLEYNKRNHLLKDRKCLDKAVDTVECKRQENGISNDLIYNYSILHIALNYYLGP